MPTRLTEMAVLEGRLQTGHDRAIAQGHLLTDAVIEGSEDPVAMRRGRILGGGVALQSRPLGLAVRSDHKSVRKSSIIADAVNKRFSIFDAANIKRGVATPKDDSYIELAIYPRYQDNCARHQEERRPAHVGLAGGALVGSGRQGSDSVFGKGTGQRQPGSAFLLRRSAGLFGSSAGRT